MDEFFRVLLIGKTIWIRLELGFFISFSFRTIRAHFANESWKDTKTSKLDTWIDAMTSVITAYVNTEAVGYELCFRRLNSNCFEQKVDEKP